MKFNVWKKRSSSKFSCLTDLLINREWGTSVRWKSLEMIPLFGSCFSKPLFAPPAEAIRLTKVTDYGKMVLENKSGLPVIVPLHLGYFQNAAQNHAMCVSSLLKPGESCEFKDACCIQEAQGGYIDEADDRFIILPHPLREKAMALAGIESYSKLWEDIAAFNKSLNLKARGHLDELKRAYQPELLRTTYYLEPHPGQTGAIFLNNDHIIGIELAPDPAFWNDLHTPLVMYCYAPLRLINEKQTGHENCELTLDTDIKSLEDLESFWSSLMVRRRERINKITGSLKNMNVTEKNIEQTSGKDTLMTIRTQGFAGQMVFHNNKPAYASVFRTVSQ